MLIQSASSSDLYQSVLSKYVAPWICKTLICMQLKPFFDKRLFLVCSCFQTIILRSFA
ncbi:hypothetical protein QTJ16_004487 [Diplocarpon rosae]|uniref:Uncharacterized protein n=1 Tax=Diplocarpon rosae TaxID=946125 RepID=A0AAD9T0X6_9HELO|nr:hypothetical protein QTJ16_004487 [Diplocarpon rosae]